MATFGALTWSPINGALRVQKRHVWDSDERGHYNYVLQQQWQCNETDETRWDDVPVVDENENQADYD